MKNTIYVLSLLIGLFTASGCAGVTDELSSDQGSLIQACEWPEGPVAYDVSYTEQPGGTCGQLDVNHPEVTKGVLPGTGFVQKVSTDLCRLHIQLTEGTYDVQWILEPGGFLGTGLHAREITKGQGNPPCKSMYYVTWTPVK